MESNPPAPQNPEKPSDLLNHIEAHLATRDGVDKLLKISRYATKIILASSLFPETLHLTRRLKSFETSVGHCRRSLRLGKFVQDVNVLRNSHFHSKQDAFFAVIAYGGEGLYYFFQQFIWGAESGLAGTKRLRILRMVSAWAELIGYVGSIGINLRELKEISEDEACLDASIEIATLREEGCGEGKERKRRLRERKHMRRLAVVRDLADWLIALADIRDGGAGLYRPFLVSCAGLVSSIISTHTTWISVSSDD